MIVRSRWGWHPCSYETFVLLKRLHVAYLEALRQYAAWQRWNRKAPHNRLLRRRIRADDGHKIGVEVIGPMPEPPLSPHFTTKRQALTHRGYDGLPLKKPRTVEVVVFDDLGIAEAYAMARRPSSSAESVKRLPMNAEEAAQLAAMIVKD